MKTLFTSLLLALVVAATTTVQSQDWPEEYLGLPGDNLNLYAVMKMFQESETLEGFERSLNDENSRINNLDLNGDNLVDYIMVIDYVDDDVHNIVLRVALNRNEHQDVAVFTVLRSRDGAVQVQLVGDEALYGKNYIVEPIYADYEGETPNPGYLGKSVNNRPATVVRTTTIEINTWPLIRYIYRPGYVVWRSSWYWGYNPHWYNPWQPYYWHYYYGYHYNWRPYYQRYYRTCDHFRYTRYNNFYYTSIRTYSPQVTYRINQGHYKTTYSRPEMRRDGEALYTRTHSERNIRTGNTIQTTSEPRRSAATSASYRSGETKSAVTGRQPAATSNNRQVRSTAPQTTGDAARRSTNTISGRENGIPSDGQRANAERRSSPSVTARPANTVTNKSATTPAARQRTDNGSRSSASVTARPATTITNKSATAPATRQRTDNTARPSANVTGRTASQPSAGQRTTAPGRHTAAPVNKSATIQSPGQRSDNNSRSAPAVTNNSASRSQAAPRAESVRTPSRQSSPSVQSKPSASSDRSSSNNRSATPANNTTSRESSSSRSSRR